MADPVSSAAPRSSPASSPSVFDRADHPLQRVPQAGGDRHGECRRDGGLADRRPPPMT
ncbi:hypothetical protein [Kitasatospora acidiphila]|uniref:hypothetical protein n=1 Tax=Kitasatospora acidiphila TaxID=2567942 RepID=UPI003C70A148